jgi:formate hydrogenlyase transcriptional activator
MNKHIGLVPDEVMEVLKAYDWPGNIRELRNFIERAVAFSQTSVLRPALSELKRMTLRPASSTVNRTLAES